MPQKLANANQVVDVGFFILSQLLITESSLIKPDLDVCYFIYDQFYVLPKRIACFSSHLGDFLNNLEIYLEIVQISEGFFHNSNKNQFDMRIKKVENDCEGNLKEFLQSIDQIKIKLLEKLPNFIDQKDHILILLSDLGLFVENLKFY